MRISGRCDCAEKVVGRVKRMRERREGREGGINREVGGG